MSDTPTPPPAPKELGSGNTSPGDFNQGQLETVRKSEGLAHAAQKSDYVPLLVADGMETDSAAKLLTECKLWRELSGNAVNATTDKEQHTGIGQDDETKLKREIEYIRGKARLKITKNPGWTPVAVTAFKARYFIGSNIFSSRALAEKSAEDIIKHAGEDALPSVTPARLAAATAILESFTGTEAPQSDAQSNASQLRIKRDASFDEIIRLRHEIQFAADGAWPWWNDASQPIRREFLLPAGRAFLG